MRKAELTNAFAYICMLIRDTDMPAMEDIRRINRWEEQEKSSAGLEEWNSGWGMTFGVLINGFCMFPRRLILQTHGLLDVVWEKISAISFLLLQQVMGL